MADFEIVVGARDEATRILNGVREQTDILANAISNMAGRTQSEAIRAEVALEGIGHTLKTDEANAERSISVFNNLAVALGAVAGAAALVGSAKAFGAFGTKAVKEFKDQKAAAEELAEKVLLADGRMKGLRDSEIDLEVGADELTGAFRRMAQAGTLIGTDEHILGYTNSIKKAEEASDRAYASFGALIAPLETLRNESIESVANAFTAVLAPAVKMAEDSFDSYKAIVDIVAKETGSVIVTGMTAASVAIENVSGTVDFAVASISLGLETAKNDFVHLFTDVIPAYANWFVQNFPELISDGLGGAFIAIKNFASNSGDAFSKLFEFITSGGKGGFASLAVDIQAIASKNLLQGFEATAASLPDIVARGFTDKETELADKVAKLGSVLGKDFSEKFAENLAYFESLFKDGLGVDIDVPKENNGKEKSGNKTVQENKAENTRLLSRAQNSEPIADLLAEAKEQKAIAQKQLEAAEEANNLLRSRESDLQLELIA